MSPMQFPDGTFSPSLPFQTRTQYTFLTQAAGSGAMLLIPNAIVQEGEYAYTSGSLFASGNYPITGWQPSPTLGTNPGFTTDVQAITARARLLSAHVCGTFTGASLADGGTVYVKHAVYDRFRGLTVGGAFDSLAGVGITNTTDPAMVDYRGPLREGFETILQPLDPTSRQYIDPEFTFLSEASTDPSVVQVQEAVAQLQLDVRDTWPCLVVMVIGGPANTGVLGIEVVLDWELQPRPSSIGVRLSRPPPKDNPTFRASIGNTYRKLAEVGGLAVSRVASNAVGGFTDWMSRALAAGGTAIMTRMASRFAPRDFMSGRTLGIGPSSRIEELD